MTSSALWRHALTNHILPPTFLRRPPLRTPTARPRLRRRTSTSAPSPRGGLPRTQRRRRPACLPDLFGCSRMPSRSRFSRTSALSPSTSSLRSGPSIGALRRRLSRPSATTPTRRTWLPTCRASLQTHGPYVLLPVRPLPCRRRLVPLPRTTAPPTLACAFMMAARTSRYVSPKPAVRRAWRHGSTPRPSLFPCRPLRPAASLPCALCSRTTGSSSNWPSTSWPTSRRAMMAIPWSPSSRAR
mmetsp:Transcript_6215/g.10680  ORF Transcript_6215/g.10680 Transcript_6215/m.10680 type:complete len:242 (-) Transcript_6215:653-1378(-)